MITLTDESFDREVLQSSTPVLVTFTAPWCGPAKVAAPKIADLENIYESKVMFASIDVDEHTDTPSKLGIFALPTYILFKNGQNIAQINGADIPKVEAALRAQI